MCEGYARAMKVLCDKAGIPCVLVSGTAYNSSNSAGEAHMWNSIQLDDNWYAVDVTWNDPMGGNSGAVSDDEGEEWLLLGADTVVDGMKFAESHLAQNIVSANGGAFTNGPQLSAEKYAYSETPNESPYALNYTILEDGIISITGYAGNLPTELVIPEQIDGYKVTAIGMLVDDATYAPAFENCTTLEKVILPEGIKTIGFGAFFNCKSLKSIYIPKTVETIGELVFSQGDWEENEESYTNLDIIIYCRKNSAAYRWAVENDFSVVLEGIYNVTLETNGGTINSGEITEYDDEFGAVLPTDVKKEGYLFKGWYENEAFKGDCVTEIPAGSIGNKTFYAKWETEIKEEDEKKTGYFTRDGEKYYADSNGVLKSGWIKIGTDWHYFDEESGFCELDYQTADNYLYTLSNGKICYLKNKTSLLKDSWLTYSGARYYFDENGFAVKGWYQDGSYWYHADEEGKMANKVTKIGDKTYYFDSSYHLGSGWKKIDGVYRYFNVSENHEMCYEITMDGTKGWVNLENENIAYINASSGALTGWRNLDGFRYHFDTDGFLDTGLFQDGRYFYYGETKDNATDQSPVGNVVKGIKVIDGKVYGFHTSQYYRLSGW